VDIDIIALRSWKEDNQWQRYIRYITFALKDNENGQTMVEYVMLIVLVALAAFILAPILAWAEGPFDGPWKIDQGKYQFPLPEKPEVYLLQKGIFQCTSCNPQTNVT
jgi:hypothetical protein